MRAFAKTVVTGAAILALFCLAGCQSGSKKTQSDNTVRMAAILPESSGQSAQIENGLRRALAEINSTRAKNDPLLLLDFLRYGAQDTTGEHALAQALKEKPVALFLAGDAALWQAPGLVQKDVLSLFLTPYPPVPGITPLGARIFFNGPAHAKKLFEVVQNSDISTVAIVHSNTPLESSLAQYLAFLLKGDGVRVYREMISANEKNFDPLIGQLDRLGTQALFLIADTAQCEQIIKTAKSLNYEQPILGFYWNSPEANAGDFPFLKDFLIYSAEENPHPQALTSLPQAYAYENLMRTAAAIKAAKGAPERAKEKLIKDTRVYALKNLRFEKDGDTRVPLTLRVGARAQLPPPRTAPSSVTEKTRELSPPAEQLLNNEPARAAQ